MRGVAYDAILYDYRTADNSGALIGLNTDTSMANIFSQHLTDNIRVSNNSWGFSGLEIDEVTEDFLRNEFTQSINAFHSAIDNNTLFIFAAGNDSADEVNAIGGMPHLITELSDAWLVVASVDPDNTETGYTNRCGLTFEFCVTAPGGGDLQASSGIYGADNNGGYVRLSGTSMAAPHVTGLAAALIEKFPSLSNKDIATRIKVTSSLENLTGYSGQTLESHGKIFMQNLFGNGLVNATTASEQIGSLEIGTGSNLFTGNNINIDENKMQIPSGLSSRIKKSIINDKFIVFDSFDGAEFIVSGNKIFTDQYKNRNAVLIGYFNEKNNVVNNNKNKFTFTKENLSDALGLSWNISQGNSGLSLSTVNFWEGKASLITKPDLFKTSAVRQMSMSKSYNEDLIIGTFIQVPHQFGDITNHNSFGASLNWNPTKKTSLYSAAANVAANVNLAATKTEFDSSYKANTKVINLGLKHKFSEKIDFFGNLSNYYLDNIDSTPDTFGLKNAKYISKTFGMEFISNKYSKYSFGFYDNGSMTSGSVTLQSAIGRNQNGDLVYQSKEFSNNQKQDPFENTSIFVAGSTKIRKGIFRDSVINFNYQAFPDEKLNNGHFGVQLFQEF